MTTHSRIPCRRRLALALVVSLGLAMSAAGAGAETYFVSAQGGTDAGAGSRTAPFATFAKAAAVLTPGDTLVVLKGRYREALKVTASGRADKPIMIRGEGLPLIEADGDAVVLAGDYLVLSGVEAHSFGWGSAIMVGEHNHHIRVVDNVARDSACGGVAGVKVDYLVVEANRVFGNSRRAVWQCSGISIYQAEAADHRPGFHNVIRANLVYDNLNLVPPAGSSRTTDGNGIIVDDFDHTQGAPGAPAYTEATLIQDNIAVNNGGRGIHVYHSRNVVIAHNISYYNLKDKMLERPVGEISAAFSGGIEVYDNIAISRGSDFALLDSYATGADVWDYNLALGVRPLGLVQTSNRWGGHTFTAPEALFMRPALDPADADFRLVPGSPAERQGIALRYRTPDLLVAEPLRSDRLGPTSGPH